MYNFVNFKLKKDAEKIINKGWKPSKGRVSGNSIEFDEDCSSYLYYDNVQGRDADLDELNKMFESHANAI